MNVRMLESERLRLVRRRISIQDESTAVHTTPAHYLTQKSNTHTCADTNEHIHAETDRGGDRSGEKNTNKSGTSEKREDCRCHGDGTERGTGGEMLKHF